MTITFEPETIPYDQKELLVKILISCKCGALDGDIKIRVATHYILFCMTITNSAKFAEGEWWEIYATRFDGRVCLVQYIDDDCGNDREEYTISHLTYQLYVEYFKHYGDIEEGVHVRRFVHAPLREYQQMLCEDRKSLNQRSMCNGCVYEGVKTNEEGKCVRVCRLKEVLYQLDSSRYVQTKLEVNE